MSSELELRKYIEDQLARPRYAEPGCLSRFGWKCYAQNDEDGILQEIFRRIGIHDRSFVEFGVEDGMQCNTLWLLVQGWRGLWIEASEPHCASIRTRHAAWLASGALSLTNDFVRKDNINALIGEHRRGEIDLLSIDIDSNDYWIWEAIDVVSPRVVVMEYNAAWPPPAAVTVPYDEAGCWNGTNYFGVSLSALAILGSKKGYELVGCSLSGVNAFFVRRDLLGDHFYAPGYVEAHYEPPRYFLCALPAGHPAGLGPMHWVEQP